MFDKLKKIFGIEPKQNCLNCKYKPEEGPFQFRCKSSTICFEGELWEFDNKK